MQRESERECEGMHAEKTSGARNGSMNSKSLISENQILNGILNWVPG